MDYGPFLSHTFQLPNGNTTLRGIAVPFDAPMEGEKITPAAGKGKAFDPAKCGVLFDTELSRYSGSGTAVSSLGPASSSTAITAPIRAPAGKLIAATNMAPGWAFNGKLDDPRPIPHGPLPRDWGRYKGLYRTDRGVIFSYTVGDTQVLDMPTIEVQGQHRLFVRTLNLSPSKTARQMVIADLPNGNGMSNVPSMLVLLNGQDAVVAMVSGGPKGTEFDHESANAWSSRFPPVRTRCKFASACGAAPKPAGMPRRPTCKNRQAVRPRPPHQGGQSSLHRDRHHAGQTRRRQDRLHHGLAHAPLQKSVQVVDALRRL